MEKFIADGMLGRVARWLRLMGYDTLYFNTSRKIDMVRLAIKENRRILTKDRNLSEGFPEVVVFLTSNDTFSQLKEIKERFKLEITEKKLFTRCSLCNELLEEVDKKDIKQSVPEYVYNNRESFAKCPKCERIYWEGDHCKSIREVIKKLQEK